MAARLTTYLVVAIVASTLIAGLIVGAQRDDSDGPVDLIVHNAVVYTADGSGDKAEAVAIRGNQILRVGSDREVNRLRRPQTTVIDAHGGAVVPGFDDASVRFVEGGLALDQIDLAGAASIEEMQARVKSWAAANPEREWVIGRGWRSDVLAGLQPGRRLMDAIEHERPVVLLAADQEALWANARALQIAGITRRTPDPAGGTIERDTRTKEATGLLTGAATRLVTTRLPAPARADRARALRAAIEEAHRLGITSVQDLDATVQDLQLYEDARRAGDLDVRVYAGIRLDGTGRDSDIERLGALATKYPDDPLFKTGAVSLNVDGPLALRAAALESPYAGSETSGDPFVSPDALNRAVRLLDEQGWQVVARAEGDRAVGMALDAFEHAARSNRAVARGRRHRIDGALLVDAGDMGRFRKLTATVAPAPLALSSPDLWSRLVGEDRMARILPLRELLAARARIVLGSRWPSGELSPMALIHSVVNREASAEASEPSPSALTVAQAIDALTAQSAYASFDEQRKGTLKAGMLADMVVLSNDIFSAPPSRLNAASVAVTIFDGRIVYRKGPRTTN